jgi:hypothetical protein
MTIYVPPTGDRALDLVLEQLASNIGNITANVANIVTYNTDGSISAGDTIIGYRDRYMYVLFADDVYGTNASTSPVGRSYYGIVNTNELTAPTNPLSYSYTKISGGFGTTKNLYYKTAGGRNIQWFVGTAPPSADWVIQPNTTVYNSIDLDTITVVSGTPGANGYSVFAASVFQAGNTAPAAPTGGTYTFSTSTLVPPAGWFANVPNADISVYECGYLFSTDIGDTVTAGLWSNPSAVFRIGADGANGTNGIDGANGINGANGSNGFTTTVGVVYQANTLTPLAISSQGFYDFGNTRLTAPTGWSNVIPNNTTNTTVWSSQASFVTSNSLANIANTTPWTTPALTFQSGGVGAPGTRGFIPLAYVITTGDPTLYTNAQYTNDFSASRTNTVPPIGTGYAPIAGDTAQFAGLGKSIVKSFDGTNWVTAPGQVIDGSLIITGTVTAAQINTNSVYALTLRGGSVTGPTDTGNVGYWIDAGTGSALFTGNVAIGNNLTIGNLVTSASGTPRLAANTVGGANIINNSITATQIAPATITAAQIATNTITAAQIATTTITATQIATNTITAAQIAASTITAGQIASGTITATQIATDTITAGQIAANTITAGEIAANTITAAKIAANTITAAQIAANTITANQIAVGTITADKLAANVLSVGNIVSFNATIGNTSSPGYWLQYTTGDAHFFGNVTIGSNLTIQGVLSNGVINTNALPSTQNTTNPTGFSYGNPTNWTQLNARVDNAYSAAGSTVNAGRLASITYVPKPEYFDVGAFFPNRLITLSFNMTWSDPTNGTGPSVMIYLNGKTFSGTVPIDNLLNLQTNGPTAANPNGGWFLLGRGFPFGTSLQLNGTQATITFTDSGSINRFFNGTNYITAVVAKNPNSTNFLTNVTNISLTVQEI